MLRWAPYPFLRITISFGAGIFTYLQTGQQPGFLLPLLAGLFLVFLGAWYLGQRRRSGDWYNFAGLTGLALIGGAGFLATHYQTAKTRPDNLLHQSGAVSHYVGVVDDYIIRKPKSTSTTLALQRVRIGGHWRLVSGKVRLTLPHAALPPVIGYGEVLLVKGSPAPVKPPGNPGQFDYRRYLAGQQVYHQHFVYPEQVLQVGYDPPNRVVAASIRCRNYLDGVLRQYVPTPREYGIATALVLGIKDYLPEDIKTTYANTGTMHVLAVSGLHVAVLFYVLHLLLGRWAPGRAGKLAAFALLLATIWFYAFLTALSASVLRAVLMFTVIQTAKTFNMPANIYNTLAAAAFGLLLYNPFFLVDVGFQLSFLAVYGMVLFQPRIHRWLAFSSYLGNEAWKLVSTSLAAQLAVLPLSFYYFHQFPVYFLLANLVAVVLSNFALITGFALLAFSWVPGAGPVLGWVIATLLQVMNRVSSWLVELPFAVIGGITLTPFQTGVLYGMLVLLSLFLVKRKLKFLTLFTGLALVLSAGEVAEARSRSRQKLWTVYQVNGATAMAFIQNRQAILLADSGFYANPKNFQYQVQPHWGQLGIRQSWFDTLGLPGTSGLPTRVLTDGNQLVTWRGLRLLVCHRDFQAYNLTGAGLGFLLLSRNPKFFPADLPNKMSCFLVIMDGSDKKWYQQQRRKQLNDRAYRVFSVPERGAYLRTLRN